MAGILDQLGIGLECCGYDGLAKRTKRFELQKGRLLQEGEYLLRAVVIRSSLSIWHYKRSHTFLTSILGSKP